MFTKSTTTFSITDCSFVNLALLGMVITKLVVTYWNNFRYVTKLQIDLLKAVLFKCTDLCGIALMVDKIYLWG